MCGGLPDWRDCSSRAPRPRRGGRSRRACARRPLRGGRSSHARTGGRDQVARAAGAPPRAGMAGTRAAKAAAPAPRLRRGRRCHWGPHRRRDGWEPHARRARIPPALGQLAPPASGGGGRCGGRRRVARSSAVAPRGLGRLSPLHDGQPSGIFATLRVDTRTDPQSDGPDHL